MGVNPGEMNGFEHINSALPNWNTPNGFHIKNKDHYDRIMKENGLITYEQSVEEHKNDGNKPYILSEKARKILYLINRDKKNGKVRLSNELIGRMKEIGAIKTRKIPEYMMVPSVT